MKARGFWLLAVGCWLRKGDPSPRGWWRRLTQSQTLRAHSLFSLLFLCVTLAATAAAPQPDPAYDLFLRSDYGRVTLWLNTASGDFRWEDPGRKLTLTGRGTLAFPNLGPVVFSFAGPLPGYDWVSVSLKIYGTTATGVMAVFPEGEPTRKVVSNFYDRNTADDVPKARKAPPRNPSPPRSKASPPTPRKCRWEGEG